MGERSPHWSTEARGVFAGLERRHDARHLVRAVLEGVAFNLRSCAHAFAAGGTTVPRVSVVGGGASSDLWLQIIADVLDIPVYRRNTVSDANSLGCAITTLVGIGALDGFGAARARSAVRATFMPQEAAGYHDAAEYFDEAYSSLAGWFTRTADLRDPLAECHRHEGEQVR
jgi:xylulokinase